MKNYKLDETLLPQVWLTWMSKDGRIWMDRYGKRQNVPESWMKYGGEADITAYRRTNDGTYPFGCRWQTRKNPKLWVAAGANLMYAYAKYHKDIDRLEIAVVKYDTTRGSHKHEWSFAGDRFFIGRDKSVVNLNNDRFIVYNVRPRCIVSDVKDMLGAILRMNANDNFVNEFKKFIGRDYFTIGNGTSVNIQYEYQLRQWYMSKQKVRTNGKAQKLTDELVTMPLGSLDGLGYKYPTKIGADRYDRDIKNIIYFERVNDEWSVLRALLRNDNNEFDERWRVYLGDDGTNRIVSKSDGDWIPSSQPDRYYYGSRYYLANPYEAEEKCNRIKYILPLFHVAHDNISSLINILRFPTIEQLYKMGYKDIAMKIAVSNTPKAEIKNTFGGYYKEKEKSVLRQLGMTKQQLDKYNSLCDEHQSYYSYYTHGDVLRKMRLMLGDDLSHIDQETYENYLDATYTMNRSCYADRYVKWLNVDEAKFWKNLVRLGAKNRNVYQLVGDTLSDYNRLDRGTQPDIDWLFDCYSDVVRVHDAIIALKAEQDAERRAFWDMREAERRKKEDEYRQKIDEERKCYEYEDDNFAIRLPKNVQEIVNEGTRQRICIGGYTSRHSKGETNLFFLRRKSDEDTPFYAIEMSNDKSIVQIHGYGNKWLGNDADAIPTVIRWLRKNGIKCSDAILTCKATGYSARADYVPMPVVD